MRRLLTLLAIAALATGLLSTGASASGSGSTPRPAGAAEPLTRVPDGYWCVQPHGNAGPLDCDGHHAIFQNTGRLRQHVVGRGTGPLAATGWYRATIDHFHGNDVDGWQRVVRMSHPGSPASVDTSPHPVTSGGPAQWRAQGYTVEPDCGEMWNPFCWHWSDILGSVLGWVNECVSGAIDGVIATAVGQLIVDLISRGAMILLDPWGYVALAIGSCWINVTH